MRAKQIRQTYILPIERTRARVIGSGVRSIVNKSKRNLQIRNPETNAIRHKTAVPDSNSEFEQQRRSNGVQLFIISGIPKWQCIWTNEKQTSDDLVVRL